MRQVIDPEWAWDVIVGERAALSSRLHGLTAAQWDHPTLCAGWRVRDVAAHVIAAPQLTWGELARLLPQVWRGYNGLTLWDGRRRGSAPVADILAQWERWTPVRRGPAVVTHRENLIDILVHTQDILRPLGIAYEPPAAAPGVAARACEAVAGLLGARRAVGGVRMVASDTDFDRGAGPLVEGPVVELLMLRAGRPAAWERLRGPGVGQLVRSR